MRRHALLVYFVLAYVVSWTMVALVPVSFLFALLALFGPALAAVVVTSATAGGRGIADLFRRITIWRVGVVWYVLAIAVPLLVAAVILALLVIGEEIGWRGFALPRLQPSGAR